MITQRQFRALQARYHRNGVGGEGFFLCSWYDTEHRTPLLAAVFEADPAVAVFDPADIQSRFRGDEFALALREALAAVGLSPTQCTSERKGVDFCWKHSEDPRKRR